MRSFSRRTWLKGAGAAGLALAVDGMLRDSISRAQGSQAPLRFMIIHRPNGTIPDRWLNGSTPGDIVTPLMPHQPRLLRDLTLVPAGAPTHNHEIGMVTIATGVAAGPARSGDNWRNTARSLNLDLADNSPLARVDLSTGTRRSHLALTAWGRLEQGEQEEADRTLTYSARDVPVFPLENPQSVYNDLFGNFVPGGMTDANRELLARARRRRGSVLDFCRRDLERLRGLAPTSERERLDAQEAVIRDMERALDTGNDTPLPQCAPPDGFSGGAASGPQWPTVKAVGHQHLAVVRAAFVCDLNRVTTFHWSVAVGSVAFTGPYTGNRQRGHHSTSHSGLGNADVREALAGMDREYSVATAEFFQRMKDTPDPWGGGSLFDNTVFLYVSEQGDGDHVPNDMPFALFGGANSGLGAPGVLDASGRSTNDVWLSIFERFGMPKASLGTPDQWSGPIPGLFV